MSKAKSNPVLYLIEGIEVRKTNKKTITFSESEWVRLIKVFADTGKTLSIPKIIALLSQACQACGHDQVSITIPRNILSQSKSFSGGTLESYKKQV